MSQGWDTIFQGLDALEQRIEQAAIRGLERGAEQLEAQAKATDAYNDQTGATRASTVAFVAHRGDDGSTDVNAARAAGDAHNPEKGITVSFSYMPAEAENPHVILTAMMRYDIHLETARAGQNAFIGPTLVANSPMVADAAFAAIGEVFR